MTYRLVAAVLHHDLGKQGGHYSCYVVDHAQDKWFLANDDKVCIGNTVIQSPRVYTRPTIIQVTQVNMSQVLAQDPYMFLYEICGKSNRPGESAVKYDTQIQASQMHCLLGNVFVSETTSG